MNYELLIYLLIIIVAIVIIFKVIKKLVFAILTVIVLLILIIVGVGALVYADYNYLTSKGNSTLELVYQKDSEFILGIQVPIKNSEILIEEASSILDLNEISKDIKSDENKFLIIIDNVLFEEIVAKRSVSLSKIIPEEVSSDLNLEISGGELIDILDSNQIEEELISLIIQENEVPVMFQQAASDVLEETLYGIENNYSLSTKEIIFLATFFDSIEDEKNLFTLIEGFKKGTLEIYPNRFVFKLIRFFPVDTIRNFLPENLN